MSYCDEDCFVGDLVCLKTGYDGQHGWISAETDVGIILEIVEIKTDFAFYDKKFRCYDYIVFWATTGLTEQVPDILIERYDVYMRIINEK